MARLFPFTDGVDEWVTAVIQATYEQLQLQAAQIEDETMRRLFLEQVPDHRAIVHLAFTGRADTNTSTMDAASALSTGFTNGTN